MWNLVLVGTVILAIIVISVDVLVTGYMYKIFERFMDRHVYRAKKDKKG